MDYAAPTDTPKPLQNISVMTRKMWIWSGENDWEAVYLGDDTLMTEGCTHGRLKLKKSWAREDKSQARRGADCRDPKLYMQD